MQFLCSQFMSEGKCEQLFHEKQMLHIRISCFVVVVPSLPPPTDEVPVTPPAEPAPQHLSAGGFSVDFVLAVSMLSLLRVFRDERNIVRRLN
jgi:hypothetical protein